MNHLKYVLLSLIVFFSPLAVSSDDVAAHQLAEKLSSMNTLQAKFSQQVKDSSGTTLQSFQGNIVIKKPGKLFWKSYEPLAQTVVTNQQKQWYYDADLEQVTVQNLDGKISHTPAMILNGNAQDLIASYQISLVSQEELKVAFELKPLDQDNLFETLLLHFDENAITKFVMTDSLQQITTIRFTESKLNEPVEDSLFEFVPPPGTEILVDE